MLMYCNCIAHAPVFRTATEMYHVITDTHDCASYFLRFCYNRRIKASNKGGYILKCTVPFDERFGSS